MVGHVAGPSGHPWGPWTRTTYGVGHVDMLEEKPQSKIILGLTIVPFHQFHKQINRHKEVAHYYVASTM